MHHLHDLNVQIETSTPGTTLNVAGVID
jgi:hypothetical protein